MILKQIIIGAFIGFLSGMFGIGGSAIATPLLRSLLGVPEIFSLASPLPASIPIAFGGLFVYLRKRLLNLRIVGYTLCLGIPATVLGAIVTEFFSPKELMIATAFFVLFVGCSFLYRKKILQYPEKGFLLSIPPKILIALGGVIGFVSGFLANSGGLLLVPTYIKLVKLDVKESFGTSLLSVTGLAIPASITHFLLGHINWNLTTILSAAAIPMSYLGAKFTIRLRKEKLEKLYGIFTIIFALYFLILQIE